MWWEDRLCLHDSGGKVGPVYLTVEGRYCRLCIPDCGGKVGSVYREIGGQIDTVYLTVVRRLALST